MSFTLTIYPTSTGVGGSGGGSIPTNSPTLEMNYDGTNLLVSGPVIYPNYLLTSTTNLSATNWTVVPIPPNIVGNFWQVTNPATASAQFFRRVGRLKMIRDFMHRWLSPILIILRSTSGNHFQKNYSQPPFTAMHRP